MTIFRKDRTSGRGGGVFIAVSDKYIASHQPELDTDCEILWIKLETVGSKCTYIGAFYRPNENDESSLQLLNSSLQRLRTTNSNVWLAGDFNLPGIDWELGITKNDSRFKNQHDEFLDILNDHGLTQIITKPTRDSNILDLFLTNNETLITKFDTLPSLGESDHDVVLVESLIKPILNKAAPRLKPLYNKTNWDLLRAHCDLIRDSFLKLDHETISIESMWKYFKSELSDAIDKFVPHKIVSFKDNLPWITKDILK